MQRVGGALILLQSVNSDLDDELALVKRVVFIEVIIVNGLLGIGITFVVISISCKGSFKYLPFALKLSLILFLASSIGYDVVAIICKPNFGIEICADYVYKIFNAVDFIVYLAVDWLFASHYLKTACLFRIAFASRHSLDDLELIKHRRKWLFVLDICVYLSLLLLFIMNEVWQ